MIIKTDRPDHSTKNWLFKETRGVGPLKSIVSGQNVSGQGVSPEERIAFETLRGMLGDKDRKPSLTKAFEDMRQRHKLLDVRKKETDLFLACLLEFLNGFKRKETPQGTDNGKDDTYAYFYDKIYAADHYYKILFLDTEAMGANGQGCTEYNIYNYSGSNIITMGTLNENADRLENAIQQTIMYLSEKNEIDFDKLFKPDGPGENQPQ